MNRADITELHYITAIANLPSILRHNNPSRRAIGILFDLHEQKP